MIFKEQLWVMLLIVLRFCNVFYQSVLSMWSYVRGVTQRQNYMASDISAMVEWMNEIPLSGAQNDQYYI